MPKKQFWKDRKVLVTGHTGFKGSWLSLWLHNLGAKVTGIGLEPDTNPSLFNQLNLSALLDGDYIFDIRDSYELNKIVGEVKPEVVFHLAAQPLVLDSYRDPIGTWSTNLMGSLNVLESLRDLNHICAIVMITTDKVYKNKEWDFGYRENDQLGGHDPYSASKAACEIAISSWRSSFCGISKNQNPNLAVATARAGNVIGGGDWAKDRIIPDVIRALLNSEEIIVRNSSAKRPWQHVLEPLSGYLLLAEKLFSSQHLILGNLNNPYSSAFNFGPSLKSNRSVSELVEIILKQWPGSWIDKSNNNSFHEAGRLDLQVDKAFHNLNWSAKWSFETTVSRTVRWYQNVMNNNQMAYRECLADIDKYTENS